MPVPVLTFPSPRLGVLHYPDRDILAEALGGLIASQRAWVSYLQGGISHVPSWIQKVPELEASQLGFEAWVFAVLPESREIADERASVFPQLTPDSLETVRDQLRGGGSSVYAETLAWLDPTGSLGALHSRYRDVLRSFGKTSLWEHLGLQERQLGPSPSVPAETLPLEPEPEHRPVWTPLGISDLRKYRLYDEHIQYKWGYGCSFWLHYGESLSVMVLHHLGVFAGYLRVDFEEDLIHFEPSHILSTFPEDEWRVWPEEDLPPETLIATYGPACRKCGGTDWEHPTWQPHECVVCARLNWDAAIALEASEGVRLTSVSTLGDEVRRVTFYHEGRYGYIVAPDHSDFETPETLKSVIQWGTYEEFSEVIGRGLK